MAMSRSGVQHPDMTASITQLRKGEIMKKGILAFATSLMAGILLLGNLPLLAQTDFPRAEVFAGYSYLSVDTSGASSDRQSLNGWNAQANINANRWFGLTADVGGYYGSPFNVSVHDYSFLFGPTLTYRSEHVAPFAHALFGVNHIDASVGAEGSGSDTAFAMAFGGGIDIPLKPHFGIRLVQADWLRTQHFDTDQNNIRLSAGVLFMFGGAPPPAAISATCSASPAELWPGEPVTVTATGANFNPKHTITYAWTTDGGKMDAANAQSVHIDTTDASVGPHTANATLTDARMKKMNSATCSAAFTVKAKPMNPPQVSCSANPTTVQAGTPSTITANATSPDPGVTISSYSYTASTGTISGNSTTAMLDTAGAAAGPINVTVTATDSRALTGNCTTTVTVEGRPAAPEVSARTPIQFIERPKQKYIPWRVDNEAKGILDDDASALKNDPNAKLVIVGYADGEPQPAMGAGKKRHKMDLAAQRAVNAKAYLVQQQGIDPGRIEVRQGTGKDHVADIFWVPQGANTATSSLLQGATSVDESTMTPSENAYPKPKTAAPMHHHKKAAAAGAAEATGNAVAEGAETAGKDVKKAAKKTGHAVKKGAKATEDAVTPH